MENTVTEEIFHFVIAEALKDAFVMFEEDADSGNQDRFSKPMFFTNHLHNNRQVNSTDETVGKNIGSPLCCLELQEEKDQIDDHNADLDVVNSEYKAGSTDLFTPFLQFSEEFVNFQHTADENLGMNFSRIDNMKHHVDKLVVQVSSLRKKEALYREAFKRRCHDLWKAETEVDLLGDQVDALLGLLEKIYIILYQHSPTLQQYFQVSDTLELIKKELGGVYNASKDRLFLRKGSSHNIQQKMLHEKTNSKPTRTKKHFCSIEIPAPAPSPTSPVPPSKSPTQSPSPSPLPPAPAPSITPSSPTPPTDITPPPPGVLPKKKGSKGLSGGKKAGVVFGVLIGAGLLGFAAYVYKIRSDNIRRERLSLGARNTML